METDQNMQGIMHQLRIMNQQIQAQALQIRQQATQIEANQQMATGTAEPSSEKAKLPDPTKFSGERFRYPAFEEQLVGKMRVDGSFLGSEDVKVHYAFGLLEGSALEFMRPWMQAHRDTGGFTVDTFINQLRNGYRDPELSAQARQRLPTIQQGNRSVIEYIAEFDKTFLEASSQDLPAWQKINYVRQGLSRKTGRLLVGTSQPKGYEEWCQHVKSLEREDAAETARATRTGQPYRGTPPQAFPVAPTPSTHSFVPLGQRAPTIETPPAPEVEMNWELLANAAELLG